MATAVEAAAEEGTANYANAAVFVTLHAPLYTHTRSTPAYGGTHMHDEHAQKSQMYAKRGEGGGGWKRVEGRDRGRLA